MCGGLRLAASRPARHIALVAAVVGRGDIVFRLGVGNSERLSSVQDVLEWGALYRHRHCSGCDVAFRIGLWRPMTAFDTYAIVACRAGSGVGHAWTEGLRQYHWSDISIIDYAGFQVLTVAPGLGFWLHAAYSYMLLLLDSLLLVRQYLHSPPAYRRQIGAMFAATLLH